MKRIVLKKRIKSLIYLLLIFLINMVGVRGVLAEEAKLEWTQIHEFYSYAVIDGGSRLFYLKIYNFNDKPVYCIELGKNISDYQYVSTIDYESLGYTREQIDYVSLIAYYGYEYPSHRDNFVYYMAAQELIWEYLSGVEVYWTQELKSPNPTEWTDVYPYKEEILRLVGKHLKKPSFVNQIFQYSVSDDSIEILDENGVLSNYEIFDNGGIPVSIVGNSLVISHDGQFVGDYEITFKKSDYMSGSSMIYYNESSQKLFSVGSVSSENFSIRVHIDGANLVIKKNDAITQSIYPYGDGSLEGAIYGIYDSNNNFISEISTDENGEAVVSNLPYGKYYVKELVPSYGYELDDTVYSIVVDKKDNEVIVYEEPIVRKVEIYKTYGDEYEPEGGSIFDIYDDSEELCTTIITDDKGYGNALLPYGLYTIRQRYSKDGYLKVDDFELKIDEDSDDVVSYNLNDKKKYTEIVVNPSTYDDIKKHFIWFIISFVLLILSGIYSVIFYRYYRSGCEIYE